MTKTMYPPWGRRLKFLTGRYMYFFFVVYINHVLKIPVKKLKIEINYIFEVEKDYL